METDKSIPAAESAANPYAPPASHVTDVAEAIDDLRDASRVRRFANYAIDFASIYALAAAAGVSVALLGQEEWLEALENMSRLQEYALGMLLMLVYYLPQEALWGRTLGKLITRTRAVQEDGSPLTARHALLRTLSRLVPFEPFSIFKGEPRAWHDTWPGTRVVMIPR